MRAVRAVAAAAGGSGAEVSASCAAALRGALGHFMAHGPAATRSALDGGAADLFGEAISRHTTLVAAALLPDLPALASGAKTAFLRAEAFRLLAALFKAKDKASDKEGKEEQPAKKAKKAKGKAKEEAALGPMQAAAAPAALAAACSALEAAAAALEAAGGGDKDGDKDEGVGKPRRLLPVMELADAVAAAHPAALAVTAGKGCATLGARLGAAAAAVGGRSMAQAVQQGARRVLAALEASGLAAPAIETPQHKHKQHKHEGNEGKEGE